MPLNKNTKQLTLSCTNKNLPGTYEGTTCRHNSATACLAPTVGLAVPDPNKSQHKKNIVT